MTGNDSASRFSPSSNLLLGVIMLVVGYVVLYMVDANATNWAAGIAPPLLVAAYAVVGTAIYRGALGGNID